MTQGGEINQEQRSKRASQINHQRNIQSMDFDHNTKLNQPFNPSEDSSSDIYQNTHRATTNDTSMNQLKSLPFFTRNHQSHQADNLNQPKSSSMFTSLKRLNFNSINSRNLLTDQQIGEDPAKIINIFRNDRELIGSVSDFKQFAKQKLGAEDGMKGMGFNLNRQSVMLKRLSTKIQRSYFSTVVNQNEGFSNRSAVKSDKESQSPFLKSISPDNKQKHNEQEQLQKPQFSTSPRQSHKQKHQQRLNMANQEGIVYWQRVLDESQLDEEIEKIELRVQQNKAQEEKEYEQYKQKFHVHKQTQETLNGYEQNILIQDAIRQSAASNKFKTIIDKIDANISEAYNSPLMKKTQRKSNQITSINSKKSKLQISQIIQNQRQQKALERFDEVNGIWNDTEKVVYERIRAKDGSKSLMQTSDAFRQQSEMKTLLDKSQTLQEKYGPQRAWRLSLRYNDNTQKAREFSLDKQNLSYATIDVCDKLGDTLNTRVLGVSIKEKPREPIELVRRSLFTVQNDEMKSIDDQSKLSIQNLQQRSNQDVQEENSLKDQQDLEYSRNSNYNSALHTRSQGKSHKLVQYSRSLLTQSLNSKNISKDHLDRIQRMQKLLPSRSSNKEIHSLIIKGDNILEREKQLVQSIKEQKSQQIQQQNKNLYNKLIQNKSKAVGDSNYYWVNCFSIYDNIKEL
eukprot:403354108